MPNRNEEAARVFKALHAAKGGFIMPNAWDAGSAVVLAAAGFPAIATTSAGIAFALAKQDYAVTSAELAVPREEMFERMGEIARVTNIPVNADLQAGYRRQSGSGRRDDRHGDRGGTRGRQYRGQDSRSARGSTTKRSPSSASPPRAPRSMRAAALSC